MHGTIKSVRPDQHFGFLTDSAGVDRFFHETGVVGVRLDTLKPRDAVTFEPEEHKKGPRATAVALRPRG